MRELVSEKDKSCTRSQCMFNRPSVNSVYKGENSFRAFGPIVWDQMLPNEYKSCNSLLEFKNKIKKWIPKNCVCRLCKNYLPHVGFTTISTN